MPSEKSSDRQAPPAVGELLTVVPAGQGVVPRRGGGQARDRVVELTTLILNLLHAGDTIDELAYRKSLEARAPASVKALANDLACYADFCSREPGLGLPADAARIVAYLEHCEERSLKPASVGRRLASLAVVHGLLGVPSLTRAPVVRDALRGFRRRVDITQRQAGPLRFGEGVGSVPAGAFTLSALLQACPNRSGSHANMLSLLRTVRRCSPFQARKLTRKGRAPMLGFRLTRCDESELGATQRVLRRVRCSEG